jgi:hypothetical protein
MKYVFKNLEYSPTTKFNLIQLSSIGNACYGLIES